MPFFGRLKAVSTKKGRLFQSVEKGYPVHGAPAARKGKADDFPAGLRVVDTAGPAFIPPPSPVHGADVTERELRGREQSCIPLFYS